MGRSKRFDIATFNNDHSIYQMLDKRFQETFTNKNITYTASAWDYGSIIFSVDEKSSALFLCIQKVMHFRYHISV